MTTVKDPTNEWYSTRQQSPLTAFPRRGAVFHHGATTSMDQILDMETSGSRQVSSNRVTKDKRCAKVVDDVGVRAWSLSDAYWDSVLRSCECANESTAGWTISAESHETNAQMCAFWASTEGWYPHRNGDPTTWTVFGHREIYTIFGGSYPTACPGGMDLDWIATRAQQILAGSPAQQKRDNDMAQLIRKTFPRPDGSDKYSKIRLLDLFDRCSEYTNLGAANSPGTVAFNTIVQAYGPFTEATDAQWAGSEAKLARPVLDANLLVMPLPTGGGSGGSGLTADQIDAVIADEEILAALKALDTQSDNYQAQLLALIKQGVTGTITLVPPK